MLGLCSDSETERLRETKQGSVHPRLGRPGTEGTRPPFLYPLQASEAVSWTPERGFQVDIGHHC